MVMMENRRNDFMWQNSFIFIVYHIMPSGLLLIV